MTDTKDVFAQAEPTIRLDPSADNVLIEDPSDLRILNVMVEVLDEEREACRETYGKQISLLGDGVDRVDLLPWDTFLMSPKVVERCAARAKVRPYAILRFARDHCKPTNVMAIFWMHAWWDQLYVAPPMPSAEDEARFSKIVDFAVSLREAENAKLRAKMAAEARHSKPGGSRDLAASLQALWATGKFRTRGECAEMKYDALGFNSLDTARKALINSPDPDPWPAKKG